MKQNFFLTKKCYLLWFGAHCFDAKLLLFNEKAMKVDSGCVDGGG